MKKSRILVYILIFVFLCFIVLKANKTNEIFARFLKKSLPANTSMNIENIGEIDNVAKDFQTSKNSLTIKTNENSSYSEMTKTAKKALPKEVFSTYTTETKDGTQVIKKIYKVQKDKLYYLVNEDNQHLTKAVYDDFSIFDEKKGIFITHRNNQHGLVNHKGRMLIPTKFNAFQKTINENYVIVQNHRYSGLYDLKRAKMAALAIYSEITPLDKYNWKLVSNKKIGLLHCKCGNSNLIKPKYENLEVYGKYFKTSLGTKKGLIDRKSGKLISEPHYDSIELINEQNCEKDNILIFKTKTDNRYGVIYYSKDSSTIISPIYDDVQYKGLVNVFSNGYWRILDNKGNVVSRAQGAFK